MFTALFSVNREMGPALRLQSIVEPLKTKDNAVLSRLAAFFGLSAHRNKRKILHRQMDEGKKLSVKTSSHCSGPPGSSDKQIRNNLACENLIITSGHSIVARCTKKEGMIETLRYMNPNSSMTRKRKCISFFLLPQTYD